ncbi:hypothetical protein JCM3766R1_002516 [Sporobolomyces carnicolor]
MSVTLRGLRGHRGGAEKVAKNCQVDTRTLPGHILDSHVASGDVSPTLKDCPPNPSLDRDLDISTPTRRGFNVSSPSWIRAASNAMPIRLTETSWLPRWRFAFLTLLAISSIATLLASIATLAYQLQFTLLVCSALSLSHSSCFLSPITSHAHERRLHLQALRIELVTNAALGLFTLATVTRLHSSTPGLYLNCGGYFMCTSLQADVALAWLSFLFHSLVFVPLLVASLYHYRRTRSSALFRRPFNLFEWDVYRSRGKRAGGSQVDVQSQQRDDRDEVQDSRFVIS